jgi:hypothetical protein
MNLIPAKLGAEPKKVAAVAVLFAVAAYFYISNRNSGESDAPAHSVSSPVSSVMSPTATGPKSAARPGSRSAGRVVGGRNPREYRPSMKPPKGVEPSSVDPTLHLGAMAKLQDVKLEATTRSLFEISAAPPEVLATQEVAQIKVDKPFVLVRPESSAAPSTAAAHSQGSCYSSQVLRLRKSRASGCQARILPR